MAGRTAVARAFGLRDDGWMRHANPASVWTRFATLPLLALAVWSRTWIGWLSLVPILALLVWVAVNPRFFRPPASLDSWASHGVLGERMWTEAPRAALPQPFRSAAPAVATALQVAGLAVLVYGLVVLDPVATVAGSLIVQGAKGWYVDRMALLFGVAGNG